MRTILGLLVALMALPAAAEDGFTLGLTEMDFSIGSSQEADSGLGVLASNGVPSERPEVLAFQASLSHTTAAQRVDALWTSDMGRLYYELAVQQSMLGREGLVNGGRMAGVGLATAGIGDGDPNGALGMALGRGGWAEMNANQRLQAGIEAGILGALIAFMVSNAN